jgi:hypothetical protein
VKPFVEILQSLVKRGALGADEEVVQPLGNVPHALMISDDEVMHPFPEILNAFFVGAKLTNPLIFPSLVPAPRARVL